MTLIIQHPEVDKLTQELIHYTGETPAQAIIKALQLRLEQERHRPQATANLQAVLVRIGRECAMLPVLDSRIPDLILGYDDHGIPA